MEEVFTSSFCDLCSQHPLPKGVSFKYGTAGFRTDGTKLDGVAFRMGILAALRAHSLGRHVGLCFTASHNAPIDNGLKIVDPGGEMLHASWEPYATLLANAKDSQQIKAVVNQVLLELPVVWAEGNRQLKVCLGRDTRPSGLSLCQAAVDGCRSVGQQFLELGLLTTPQVHFFVREFNKCPEMGATLLPLYKNQLVSSFKQIIAGTEEPLVVGTNVKLLIDCGNGVGAVSLQELQPMLQSTIEVTTFNSSINDASVLNHHCGADFVQKEQCAPCNTPPTDPAVHLATVDGDADRVVFFTMNPFRLLDGDKILTLFAIFIKQQLDVLGLQPSDVAMGVVQTAYANGASTNYIRNVLQLPTSYTPTGVKHLHHKAQGFDIGLYFEANGHGTVIFSEKVFGLLSSMPHLTEAQQQARQRLMACAMLLNPTVGDAIADALMVEGCLHVLGWGLDRWQAVYMDLPSRQTKVPVPDPKQVSTTWDETQVLAPPGLQDRIDQCVAKYGVDNEARAFVRPSGTEPIVRIYAEATTQADADALASDIAAVLVQTLS
eukprot:GGOE01004697.1.p1 GENE.GGOE01004697.1~~GGOE01004697.1.p1  ORF type:complete len:556 (+),score=137.79 GGOE01004697.1:29-1669(+)